MKKMRAVDRRQFITRTTKGLLGAAMAPAIVPSSVFGNADRPSPSNRVTVGCIGVGPRGTDVMRDFLQKADAQVVAVCDVKANVLKEKQALVHQHYKGRGCAAYHDFRELLDREDIDAVLVATPDHWHVLTSLAAVRSGKDVYMEKPMGLSLEEDQAIRQAVKQRGRIFQFGTQQRSDRRFRLACELVRNGRIGALKEIRVWSPGSVPGGPTDPVPIPEWLDYDFWLGPAPFEAYTENRCSNQYWWYISDYALGFIAGWGVHPLDIARWGAADHMTGPWRIAGSGEIPSQGLCDTSTRWDVQFRFASGVSMQYLGLSIEENTGQALGANRPYSDRYGRTTSHGTAFEGSEGWVHVDRNGIQTHPESLLETQFQSEDTRLMVSQNHVRNFLDGVKTRGQTVSPVEEAVQADILCHVSDIAVRLKKPLIWDPAAEQFIHPGHEDANRRMRRPMRHPWNLQSIS